MHIRSLWHHLLLALIGVLLVGCSTSSTPSQSAFETVAVIAEATDVPTATVPPTEAIAPSVTSTPTAEPTLTASPTTEPTATEEPSPTVEPSPTAEPSPTTEPTAIPTPQGPTAIVHAVTPVAPNDPLPTDEPLPTDAPAEPTDAPPAAVLSYVFPLDPSSLGEYGSCHHDYPASDIFTPRGTHFVAVTGGVVEFISVVDNWNPATDDPAERGGISVSVVGDDGVRYYGSHLQSVADGIEPGVRVQTGQLLGLTGASGNARSTPPHLHFGISHPTNADDWQTRRGEINPVPYLRAWRQGEQRTPDLTVVGGGAC